MEKRQKKKKERNTEREVEEICLLGLVHVFQVYSHSALGRLAHSSADQCGDGEVCLPLFGCSPSTPSKPYPEGVTESLEESSLQYQYYFGKDPDLVVGDGEGKVDKVQRGSPSGKVKERSENVGSADAFGSVAFDEDKPKFQLFPHCGG